MASVRQADTALWLHNKLSSDDSWSGSSLRSLLTQDVLRNIPECFHRLETQVKVKLLMAFLHLPRRVIEETNGELSEIFEIGSHDEDEWVRVLSEIMKYYPSTGMLNVNLDQASPVFAEVSEEIMKTVANLPDSGSSFLPLECLYLNKSALVAMVGPQPPLPKHFTLRRKPKSAALRAELTQKASEALSAQKKGNALSSGHKLQSTSKKFEAPVRVTQRTSNTASYRPTPNRSSSSSGSSRSIISAATLKHHGRTKLLDITEQPIGGGRELKRRKKMAANVRNSIRELTEEKRKNEEVQAYWDVPVCGELQGVRANLVDACIMNRKTKQVVTFQLSCPWIGNRERKSGEKTLNEGMHLPAEEEIKEMDREEEIYTSLYYVNEESDEVIGGSTKTVQHSIKNNSRNIGAVFFKLGTRNVHHKRESITPTVVVMATLSAPVSFCKKPNMHMTEETEHGEDAKQKKPENTKPLEPATPEYAAGLTPVTQSSKPPSSPETPSISLMPAPASTPSYVPQAVSSSSQGSSSDVLSESTINLKRELEMHVEQQRQIMMRERQQKQAAAAGLAASSVASTASSSVDPLKTPATVSTTAPPGSSQQQQAGTKRQLTLTREQMLAAHEMFKNANRVSRAEKALILGFMAGAREKPYAHQGPIITIKLSENTENVTASDGSQQTQLVEMLFEMNYDTGHWRRLKRTRVVSKQSGSGPLQNP
ncbi:Negative elongation factor A [Acropora cervicornis]|uniref:Negative elongation factor A n=1 Tax=Acropora cervicornis TaxID=6130 RepID=A0AAD9QPA2_ACRCE|nr:Negative elongation factor A [Acropora cervicornis]